MSGCVSLYVCAFTLAIVCIRVDKAYLLIASAWQAEQKKVL